MTIINRKINHPWTALAVVFMIGALLNNYGISNGSLLLLDLIGGVAVYRMLTYQN